MPDTSPSIMARLRGETKAHHEHAENRELQRALAKGSLPRDHYVVMLGQRLLIHRVLERELRKLASSGTPFSALVDEALFQEANLRTDLEALGLDPDSVKPISATSRLTAAIKRVASEDPVALFGTYYVFEGSKNGARYLVHRVAAAYGLKHGPGLLYLDPHGEQQPALWSRYKAKMDAAGFGPQDQDAIVAAARKTFDLVAEVDDQLYAAEHRVGETP